MKKGKKRNFGPVVTILILTLVVVVASAIFSLLGISSNQVNIINGSLETSLVTVNNVLTRNGIKFVITSTERNLQIFEPLIILIVSLIAVSIGEASGLFKAVFTPLKRINSKFLTFLVLLTGIVSTFFGEHLYMVLLPIVAILYQTIGKKPLLGIITTFLGITVGYGIGFIYNNEEIVLSVLTQAAVNIDIDKTYTYNLYSNLYIHIVSTLVIAFIGTIIIHTTLDKKIPKSSFFEEDEENLIVSKKALHYSTLAFFIMMAILLYMVTPGLYRSGVLLGDGNTYIEQLLGETSPFQLGLGFIFVAVMMVCGFIYGAASGNIKNSTEYSVALSKNFEGLGYVFVLLFFTSQLIGIFEWTNLGPVIVNLIVSLISKFTLTGIIMIMVFFIAVVLMTLLVPSTTTKWAIIAPQLVPLMMRANISPSFTQFIFRAADGVGKCLTPFFVYYIIMLAFLEKYNTKENNQITVIGTFKIIFTSVILFGLLWIFIIICWYLLGTPTGIGVYPTL